MRAVDGVRIAQGGEKLLETTFNSKALCCAGIGPAGFGGRDTNMKNKRKRVTTVKNQEIGINLDKLQDLGYSVSDGVYTNHREFLGELMPVEDIDTGEEATFCCFYMSDREKALIIPHTFEEALARHEKGQQW